MKYTECVTFESYRDFKGYVINLDREQHKYLNARKNLTKLGFSNIARWSATDYRQEDVDVELKNMGEVKLDKFVNNAEKALAISHYKIWTNFLASDEKYCLIFEDDVIGSENFKNYADFTDISYGDFDLLFFGGVFLSCLDHKNKKICTSLKEAKELQKNKSCIANPVFWQAHAYLISRKGAYKAVLGYPEWLSSKKKQMAAIDIYLANHEGLDILLSANQDIPNIGKYSLADHWYADYGAISERICGILLQEKHESRVQNI